MAKMPPIEIWKSRYEHEILDFLVEDEPFQSVLLRLEKQVDLSLDASQFKASPKISYSARNKPWQEVLEDLARKVGAASRGSSGQGCLGYCARMSLRTSA